MQKQHPKKIEDTIQNIVQQAQVLKDKHTAEKDVAVNYACIFTHTDEEYRELDTATAGMGRVVKETKMGNIYWLEEPIKTIAGPLRMVKIRKPDPTRPEQGDADFTVNGYQAFKNDYLGKSGFKLIKLPEMEMIELVDNEFNIRAYFSHPTLEKILSSDLKN